MSLDSSDKNEGDRANLLGYITPIITDYAENNRINPAVCYEVCHELELMMVEKCKAKGMNTHKHKQVAETGFKKSKQSRKMHD